jgi:hypothetical protein
MRTENSSLQTNKKLRLAAFHVLVLLVLRANEADIKPVVGFLELC